MIKTLPLMTELTGVSAMSTLAGFNICTYAGAAADASVESSMRELEAVTGITRSRIFTPVQTHGTEVRVVGPGIDLRGVDGVVCVGPDVLIGVHTADCLPLLMVDCEARVAAAVHCGWRGTVAGIALNALRVMESVGARPGHIHAAMGPCICRDCFEVGEEVAGLFPKAVVSYPHAEPKPRVDLAAAVAFQLRQAGVRDIALPPACSKHSDVFYSVRRQGRTLPFRTLTAIYLSE